MDFFKNAILLLILILVVSDLLILISFLWMLFDKKNKFPEASNEPLLLTEEWEEADTLVEVIKGAWR